MKTSGVFIWATSSKYSECRRPAHQFYCDMESFCLTGVRLIGLNTRMAAMSLCLSNDLGVLPGLRATALNRRHYP